MSSTLPTFAKAVTTRSASGGDTLVICCLLEPLLQVEVVAEVGNWYKVRWHKRAKEKDKGKDKDKEQQSTPLSAKDDGDERKTHATPADLSPADPSPAASSSDAAAAAGDAKDAVREKSDDNRQEGGGDEQEEPECADDSSMEGGAGKGTCPALLCVTKRRSGAQSSRRYEYICRKSPERR